jgi:hypothetical protein
MGVLRLIQRVFKLVIFYFIYAINNDQVLYFLHFRTLW